MAGLQDFCDLVQGGRHKLSGRNFIEAGYPAYGAGGLNGYLPEPEFSRDGIVLSAIGARCGKCFLAEGNWSSLANTQIIFPDSKRADVRYLWYQLNDEARWPRHGLAQPFIRPSDVKAHRVYLPALNEQRRIAAILDKADALRRKRKCAAELLDGFTQSLFHRMFVPPYSEIWPEHTIDSLAVNIRTGPFGSQLLHSEFVNKGIAVLGIDNAVANEFRWSGRRYISKQKYGTLRRYTVLPRDLLITIMGTCGRCAIVPDNIPVAINTKHLCCISLNEQKCLAEFLHAAFLQHPHILRQLGVQAKGAVMPGLNMGIIKSLSISLPPLNLQRAFARQVSGVRKELEKLKAAKHKSDALFSSLQHRAFSGQL